VNLVLDNLELDLCWHFKGLVLLALRKDGLQSTIKLQLLPLEELIEVLLEFEVNLDGLAFLHDRDAVVLPALDEGLDLHADSECLGTYMEPTSSRQG
jgi:hypothetical protein